MVRDLEEESKRIRNGNRYVDEIDGTGVFARDTDRLFVEYENLRNKLYNKYKVNFRDEPSRKELKSYIDEQFIKLVKEYDINNPVDFPGYVKRKLYARVGAGFVKRNKRDRYREGVAKDEGVLEQTTEDVGIDIENSMAMQDLITFIFRGVNLEDYEKVIVIGWLNGESDTDIIKDLTDNHDISRNTIQTSIQDLKDIIKRETDAYKEQNKG